MKRCPSVMSSYCLYIDDYILLLYNSCCLASLLALWCEISVTDLLVSLVCTTCFPVHIEQWWVAQEVRRCNQGHWMPGICKTPSSLRVCDQVDWCCTLATPGSYAVSNDMIQHVDVTSTPHVVLSWMSSNIARRQPCLLMIGSVGFGILFPFLFSDTYTDVQLVVVIFFSLPTRDCSLAQLIGVVTHGWLF